MADIPDSRGFTLLWRKTWDCEVLKERGRPFSKREAWLHITNVLAQGVSNNGTERGEFISSYRYMAGAWNWETTKVFRFIKDLEQSGMILRKSVSVQHQTQHQTQHFIICNYETYNPTRNTLCNTKRNKLKEGIKESIKEKEEIPAETVCTLVLKSGEEFPVTSSHVENFKQAYPGLDIPYQLAKMKAWCMSNPDKLKTRTGILRFVNSWLSRAFDENKSQSLFASAIGGIGAPK